MKWDKDPYVILGVAEEASNEEVKSSYRRLARRMHPDVNADNRAAAEQFQDITTAYEILSDPIRRKAYHENRPPQNDDELYFTLQVTPSKRSLTPLPEPQVLYVLADIFPDPRSVTDSNRETRMNLTLVLDRSNSMSGARMEKVKIAAHQIIDNMHAEDIISVVSFNDRAETIIEATTVTDRPALKAKVSMISPSGGTEIYQGLNEGVKQNRKFLGPRLVNHVILLTDGHTFGDQDKCLELATHCNTEGIGMSALGLGSDWNDKFLDDLVSRTGGNSMYVKSANSVVKFLNEQVKNLTQAFAERVSLSIAVENNVQIESIFKLSPHPQPLEVNSGVIPLGSLQSKRPISVLIQFQLPANMDEGFRYIARIMASGEILSNQQQAYQMVSDFSSEVAQSASNEDPPTAILDALSKLTLYRLQERAQDALASGDVSEATRRLQNLATRLLEMGQDDLANQALSEARRVAYTSDLSDKGRKALKYQTRYLLMNPDPDEDNQQ
jgi:Ca-activated chloride channel homolog